jgi:hypothetical protein
MLSVKANNGELKEILRFQKLARGDLKIIIWIRRK